MGRLALVSSQEQMLLTALYLQRLARRLYLGVSEAVRRQILSWLGVPPEYFATVEAVLERADLGSVEVAAAVTSMGFETPTAIIDGLLSATSVVNGYATQA